jgi:hypothetical protein
MEEDSGSDDDDIDDADDPEDARSASDGASDDLDADADEDAAAALEGGDAFDADGLGGGADDDAARMSDEEEEAELALRSRRSMVPKEEEDAFEKELSSVLGDSGSGLGGGLGMGGGMGGKGFGLRPLSKGGALPMMSLGSAAAAGGGGFGGGGRGGGGDGATVSFKMLTRRDGRNSTRELHVPIASEMATLVAAQQEAEEAERSELKRLVLDQVALSDSNAAAADAAMHPPGRVLFSTAGVRGGDRYRRRLRS